tara:strand:- start:3 stop:791 length:789 start_codon:yes stop_codon:yes gene_type:complete
MLESMIKVLLKIIKNKKFTKFAAIITLLIMAFMVSNSESSLVQTIVYITQYNLVRVILLIIATFLLSVNIQLGLLFVIFVAVIINIPKIRNENFSNIPNMVDKGSIIKYNKNFKEPKDLKTKKEKQKNEDEKENKDEKDEKDKKKDKKRIRKKGFAISEDYYHEKRGINKEDSEKNNVEEVNLDNDEDDTIEKELKKKFTNDLRKLEEFDSSSSDSSDSESSDSSTDSSDSEKELEEVSMNKARDHMLKKLRNGIKKRYIHD